MLLWGEIITALFGIGLAWLVRLALTAPLGFENASGFHYGNPDRALAHCPLCDLWLTDRDSCLHIQAVKNTGAGLANRDQLTRPVSAPFHSSTNSREAKAHHAS